MHPGDPSDIETQYESIRRLGPALLKAFQTDPPDEDDVKTTTHACKVIVQLLKGAPCSVRPEFS